MLYYQRRNICISLKKSDFSSKCIRPPKHVFCNKSREINNRAKHWSGKACYSDRLQWRRAVHGIFISGTLDKQSLLILFTGDSKQDEKWICKGPCYWRDAMYICILTRGNICLNLIVFFVKVNVYLLAMQSNFFI